MERTAGHTSTAAAIVSNGKSSDSSPFYWGFPWEIVTTTRATPSDTEKHFENKETKRDVCCGPCTVTADAFIIGSTSLISPLEEEKIFVCRYAESLGRPVVVRNRNEPPVCLFLFSGSIGLDGNNREATEMQTSLPLSNEKSSWRWEKVSIIYAESKIKEVEDEEEEEEEKSFG
ncbi:hypothetical protein DAPPUDRAFT_101922 [Daphnia pulex]|uniref:Uncharacterized protein n=1 Tax=Daphnia pulex TaxID=6669 RepID=E9GEW4_DAPPU|nr:hypothetical protein DAPPUDRAFT_101922 [Daphnia pulex]|eukprot:EFX82010.1 hypothetical protein DAPPUDRAFT_101922 [Daphnia pulex]